MRVTSRLLVRATIVPKPKLIKINFDWGSGYTCKNEKKSACC